MATSLLSEIEFASLLVYSPRGAGEADEKSRKVRDQVKHDRAGVISLAAQRIEERGSEFGIGGFIRPHVLLVPAPRSAPLESEGALWPAHRICEELHRRRLVAGILTCLVRTEPVPKSAFAVQGERTKASRHLETLRADRPLVVPEHEAITVVDDFVTTGAMLLASVSRVAEVFPSKEVRGFALVRRMDEVTEILAPCVGRITLDPRTGDSRRRP